MRCATLLIFSVATLGYAQEATFTNPIFDRFLDRSSTKTSDSVVRIGDFYYLTYQNLTLNSNHFDDGVEIVILKSPVLTNFTGAERYRAFKSEPGFRSVEASQMIEIDGSLYIYFVMGDGLWAAIRPYVIKANNASDPLAGCGEPTEIFPRESGLQAGDCSIMKHDGKLYFLRSESSFIELEIKSTIYIHEMLSPTSANPAGGVAVRVPNQDWECRYDVVEWEGVRYNVSTCTNDRPSVVYNKDGTSFLVFTVQNGYPDSALSYMSIAPGQNPMNVSQWTAPTGRAFNNNLEEDVNEVCCSSFTVSPDNTETWMIYHGARNGSDHLPMIERIGWNPSTGRPEFPIAHGNSNPQPVPSGQQ